MISITKGPLIITKASKPCLMCSMRYKSIVASKLGITTSIIDNKKRSELNDKSFITEPAFPHPPFSNEECEKIGYDHRTPLTFSDKVAFKVIRFVRRSFDFVTGYKEPHTANDIKTGFKGTRWEMTPNKWLTRCIFLESIAGVPGMVAAFIRHLHSLRLLRRDKAWIETLLDEAYNERMHLLTFIKIGSPSWFTRTIIYIGQGVFCNMFFLAYLIRPKFCHRLVGYLEEEAVATYSHLLEDMSQGRLTEFDHVRIPEISWHYWKELSEESSFKDLILRIRADEAKHREVNHTLANLTQKCDRNPFALQVKEEKKVQPTNGLQTHRARGWDRKDLIL